jgi:glycosyltransferase involved in cell wall biosynthesis
MKILAIVPYHLDYCAGQRFRIELWAKELANRGIDVEFLPFTNDKLTDVLYTPGKNFKKASLMMSRFTAQLLQVFNAGKPDLVFIYREAALAGPAIIERIVRRWGVPIVYDIDEPLFVPYVSPTSGKMSKLKFFSKVDDIFRLSDCVFAVNKAIGDHAGKFCDDVEIVPMTIDTDRYSPAVEKTKSEGPLKVVWVGTRTNQPNIERVVPVLRKLAQTHKFVFKIIADEPMNIEGIDTEFIKWGYDIEVDQLRDADIGITPVTDSVWSKWKFFFKTVQFMGIGLPVVASKTGSNLEIINDGTNGFLADTDQEWEEKLRLLLDSRELRLKVGAAGRQTVLERYDINKQFDFLEVKFRSLCHR